MLSLGRVRRSLSEHLNATLWTAFVGSVTTAIWIVALFSPLLSPSLGFSPIELLRLFGLVLFAAFIVLFVGVLAIGAPVRWGLSRTPLNGPVASALAGAFVPTMLAIAVLRPPPAEWFALGPVAGIGAVCVIVYGWTTGT